MEPEETSLLDLPPTVMSLILRLVDACDVCNVARTCAALREAGKDELVWKSLSSRFPRIDEDCAFDAAWAATQFTSGSYRTLYQLLTLWRGWPIGLWREADRQPRGGLIQVRGFVEYVSPDESVFWFAFTSWRWGLQGELPGFVLSPFSVQRTQVRCVCEEGDITMQMTSMHGLMIGRSTYERVPGLYVPLQRPLPAPPPLPGRLRGIYTSYYGSHGSETILVRMMRSGYMSTGDQPLPTQLAYADGSQPAMRLEGYKLTGDPNVPSGKFTFVADATVVEKPTDHPTAVQPWDAYDEDGALDPHAVSDQRPIFMFDGTGHAGELNLEERRPSMEAVYPRCWGQINVNPGSWDPQWVAACVIVYSADRLVSTWVNADGERVVQAIAFSILWKDDDERAWRHAMDFTMRLAAIDAL